MTVNHTMLRATFIITFFIFSVPLATAQSASLVKLKELQKMMSTPSDKIQVVNFWATWCAPCVRELPLFEKLNKENLDVKVMLVSMDYDLDPNPDKVNRFVQRKKINSDVLLLTESNPNEWIDKIEQNWSGAIPATIVINSKNGKRRFVEKELKEGELEKLIEEVK